MAESLSERQEFDLPVSFAYTPRYILNPCGVKARILGSPDAYIPSETKQLILLGTLLSIVREGSRNFRRQHQAEAIHIQPL